MRGKKRYIALVLFLLTGLVTFSFANPNEEQMEPATNTSKPSASSKEEKEDVQPNKDVELGDELTLLPEEDVVIEEDVEEEPARENVTTGEPTVIDEEPNGPTGPTVDVGKLVAKAEELVEEATSKDGITESEEYFNTNAIDTAFQNMPEGKEKEDLRKRINTLKTIYNDETAPEINGLPVNGYTNTSVSLTIVDATETTITVTFNGEPIEFAEEFNEEGTYVIKVVDAAHNETTKTFTIDKTPATRVYSTIAEHDGKTFVEGEVKNRKYYYMNNGDRFTFRMQFSEQLLQTPTLTIGGKNVELVLNEKEFAKTGKVIYSAEFKIAEDESVLKEGNLEIKLSNVIDLASNESTIETVTNQTVTSNNRTAIYDRTAPQLTLNGETKITLEAGIDTYEELGARVTDNVDKGNDKLLPSNINYRDANGVFKGKVSNVDMMKPGEYKISYTYTDTTGNKGIDPKKTNHTYVMRIVYVKDTTAPTIGFTGATGRNKNEIHVNQGAEFTLDGIASATDIIDKNVKLEITSVIYFDHIVAGQNYDISNGINTNMLGRFNVYYKATDAYGNTSERTLLVMVNDVTSPKIIVKEESVGRNEIYSKISFKLQDNDRIDYFTLNGKKYDRTNAQYSAANFNDIKDSLVEGKNTIVLYDRWKNKDEYTFTYDATAPAVEYVAIISFNKNYKYATNGDKIRFLVKFNEEIYIPTNKDERTFILTINGEEVKFTKSGDKSGLEYIAQYTIPQNETKLTESELTFTISGYEDIAGNTGKVLTTANHGKYNKVIYDRTAPKITIRDTSLPNGKGYKNLDIQLYDANEVASITINGKELAHKGKYVDINDGHAYTFLEGENVIVATDKAGNTVTQTLNKVVKKYVLSEDELRKAFEEGGEYTLSKDVVISKTLTLKGDKELILDMNGKKLTVEDENAAADPMIETRGTSKLTITGNGIFDLEDNYYHSVLVPYNESTVIIENGSFIKNSTTEKVTYGSLFASAGGAKSKVIIKDGYFDSGYYKEGDHYNNNRNGLNVAWGPSVKVYGGTYVGQNPAWGDEGMAKTNPDKVYTDTNHWCQGTFLEGQHWLDTTIPEEYKITEGKSSDGRPTYTVKYKDETKPIVTLNGEKQIDIKIGDTYTEEGITAKDNTFGTITITEPKYIELYLDNQYSGNVDAVNTSKVAKYVLIYTATDRNGNESSEIKRTVNVVKPTIISESLKPNSDNKLSVEEYTIANNISVYHTFVTEDTTINGNGNVIEQIITDPEKATWTGYVPDLAATFTSSNGSTVTLNNTKLKGTFNTISFGNYVSGKPAQQSNFNTVVNNVDIIGIEVFSLSVNTAPGVAVYGNLTMKNSRIYGTKLSNLDDVRWPVYDMALTNYTNTTMEDSKVGSIIMWPQAQLTVKKGTTIDKIVMFHEKNTNGLVNKGKITLEEGATIKEIIVKGTSYTFEEWSQLTN